MKRVFGVESNELDYGTVQGWCYGKRFGGVFGNAVPQRFFYYDCLRDIKKATETDQEFTARVQYQHESFKAIQSLLGFHVRLGSLSGTGKKLRQKKVDVLLAVEMLDNAFRKNMAGAVLLAGDADFIPVVEAVMRLGTWVEVCYDPHGASEELYSLADKGTPLTFTDLWSWSSNEFRTKYYLPPRTEGSFNTLDFMPMNLREGKNARGERVMIAERGNKRGEFFVHVGDVPGISSWFTYPDVEVLEKYYVECNGPINWDREIRQKD